MTETFFVEWKYPLLVTVRDNVVRNVKFLNYLDYEIKKKFLRNVELSKFSKKLRRDLCRYFSGENVDFSKYDVEIKSDFAKRVLDRVRLIEFGKVKTYGELAKELKTAPIAVGQALKANPAPVIIPCHRVISSRGIGGFSQGIEIKIELLKHEGVNLKDIL